MLKNIKNICTCPKCGHSSWMASQIHLGGIYGSMALQEVRYGPGILASIEVLQFNCSDVVIISINLWVTPSCRFLGLYR